MYICHYCDYQTNDKGNYTKHMTTYKHKQKSKNQNIKIVQETTMNKSEIKQHICQNCQSMFSTSGNLSRHKKTCSEKHNQNNQLKQIIEQMEERHKQEIDTLKSKINELTKLFEYHIINKPI